MRLFLAIGLFFAISVAANAAQPVVIVGGSIPGTSPGIPPPLGSTIEVQPPTSNKVSGTANTTATTTTSLVPLVASKRLYITAFSCANTGSSSSLISFQDGSGGTTLWTTEAPAGSGSNLGGGSTPMFWTTAGNALFFAATTASTTIYCSAAGFSGS